MGIVLAHFNPSTLKAAYRAANNKQILTKVSCSHCSPYKAPYEIDVTFSNFSYCTLCCYHFGVYSTKITNHQNCDDTFRIKWVGQLDDGYDTCRWEHVISGNFGTYTRYQGVADCSGSPLWSVTLDRLWLQLNKGNDGGIFTSLNATIYPSVHGTSSQVYIAAGENYTPSSGCLNGSVNVSNTCCIPDAMDCYCSACDISLAEV